MHHITVPEPVVLVDRLSQEKGDTVSFAKYASVCWMDDRRWGASPTKLARAIKVLERIEKAEPGETVSLEDEDYKTLKTIVEEPEKQVGGTLVMLQLVSFPQAVLDAKQE